MRIKYKELTEYVLGLDDPVPQLCDLFSYDEEYHRPGMTAEDVVTDVGPEVCLRLGIHVKKNTIVCPGGFLAAALAVRGLLACMMLAADSNEHAARISRRVLGWPDDFNNWYGDIADDLTLLAELMELAHDATEATR